MYVFTVRGITLPKQADWPHRGPSPGATPHISASSRHSPEPCLGAPLLHLGIFILASTSRTCPQVPASLLYAVLAYGRRPRRALLSDSGESWTRHCRWHLPLPSSTHPQSGHHVKFSHFVSYTAFQPCVNFPLFHKHVFI